jgi:hypothetical protein
MWARMVPPNSRLVVFSVDFFFSRSSISQKNDVAKRLGLFDIRKVPEVKNMQKKANLLRSAKTK